MTLDFAFLCLARDCAPTIPRFLGLLRALRAEGARVAAIVGENGSADGTAELLRGAARDDDVTLVPTAFMAEEPERLRRMALGRERLKAELAALDLSPRYVCVADVDNAMAAPPSIPAFLGAAKKLDGGGFFGVSATSRPHYYDLLAFEDETRSFGTLLAELARRRGNILSYYRYFQTEIYPHRRALTLDTDVRCLSAFNGMSLYDGGVYRSGSYLGPEPRLCEHVVLHRGLAQATGGRMLIDPDLVLATPDDHREEALAVFMWRRARKFASARFAGRR